MTEEVIDFAALFDLIEGRFTSHLHNRHIIAINRVCSKRKNGIFLCELKEFTKLIKLCSHHIENNRLQFIALINNLLSVTLKPFIPTKTLIFEKIECFDMICSYFELISYLLSLQCH